MKIFFAASVFALTNLITLPAFAVTQWSTTSQANAISWTGETGGVSFNGRCTVFAAEIAFDAADLVHSTVRVTIDTASCRTGEVEKDASLAQGDWFNDVVFPKAIFEAKSFHALGGNLYEADGALTLKGVTKPVKLPFTLDIKGNDAHAVGDTVLDRLAFNIGSGTSADYVAAQVKLHIDLHATRKAA